MADKKNGYHRVLLKLSGEVFGGEKGIGVDPDVVADVAEQIADVVKSGVEIAIVVGGGNYFRGAELQQPGSEVGQRQDTRRCCFVCTACESRNLHREAHERH